MNPSSILLAEFAASRRVEPKIDLRLKAAASYSNAATVGVG
jgi:hypothetical protein